MCDHQHHQQTGHFDVLHHLGWTCWVVERGLRRPIYYLANDTAPGEFQSPLSELTSTRQTRVWVL